MVPQFADSSHSMYLQRVPARQLYEPWLISRATREGLLTVQERRTDTLIVDGRQLFVERAIGSGLVGRPARERLIAVHIPLDCAEQSRCSSQPMAATPTARSWRSRRR